MRRSTLSIALYLFLIFASGTFVGAYGLRLYTGTVVANTTARAAEDARRQYLAELQSRLKLTPEQLQKLQTIRDETREHARQAHETYDSTLKQIKEHHHQTVSAMLTPQQRPEYEKFHAELEQRAKKVGKN
jgi:hypothetical protein